MRQLPAAWTQVFLDTPRDDFDDAVALCAPGWQVYCLTDRDPRTGTVQ